MRRRGNPTSASPGRRAYDDTPTIPSTWQLLQVVLQEALSIRLPNPTTTIRADNEDSFQGPVTELPGN